MSTDAAIVVLVMFFYSFIQAKKNLIQSVKYLLILSSANTFMLNMICIIRAVVQNKENIKKNKSVA